MRARRRAANWSTARPRAASPWASATPSHEYLPLYEDGPGNGQWNLDQYRDPARLRPAGLELEIDVLPPLGPTDVPKGIGELVMFPVAPAILNAISDATGKRFTTLPVTPDMIKAAL